MSKPKRPILIDARTMERQHPGTFERPSDGELSHLRAGDLVKVAVPGERFWVKIVSIDRDILIGQIENHLMHGPEGLVWGDQIEFTFSNIYSIE